MFSKFFPIFITLMISALAHAGIDDFSAVLEENQKIQNELTLTLQKQLETRDLGKAKKPDFHRVGEDVIGVDGENVAVEINSTEKADKKNKTLEIEKKSFRRLSLELKEDK